MDLPTLLTAVPVAASIVYAAIKVGKMAGNTDTRLQNLTSGLERLTASLQAFADKADERLSNHGERLARLEEARHHSRREIEE